MRKTDFYFKGMNLLIKQELYKLIDNAGPNECAKIACKNLLEKLDDHGRKLFAERKWYQFIIINDFLIARNRQPLFSNPSDVKQSAIEYLDVMKYYPDDNGFGRCSILEEYFGCTFDEYVPKPYRDDDKKDT